MTAREEWVLMKKKAPHATLVSGRQARFPLRKLTTIEKRILRRLKDHYDGVMEYARQTEWDRGWEAGYRGAMTFIAAGYPGSTPKEAAARRKWATAWVRARKDRVESK